MKCPNCSHGLRPAQYEGINIESCDSCGGQWLDALELGDITNIREKRFSEEERRAIAAATPSTSVHLGDADRDLVCPKCSATTDAVNYGGTSGIIIDRCTGCGGFWMDAGELDKVQLLVEGWEDLLPDDLAAHGEKLRDLEVEWDAKDDVVVSRVPVIGRLLNAFVNGVLDFT
jgi:uncharacterized protein